MKTREIREWVGVGTKRIRLREIGGFGKKTGGEARHQAAENRIEVRRYLEIRYLSRVDNQLYRAYKAEQGLSVKMA